MRRLAWGAALAAAMWCVAATTLGADDQFITGYAAAVLEHEFNITDASVEVERGFITVRTKTLGTADRGKVLSALEQIPGSQGAAIIAADASSEEGNGAYAGIPGPGPKWLPRGLLFSPLHADPRWPRFSADFRQYTSGADLTGVFAGNFGETFSIYRNKGPFGGEWEFGVQAGVFSIFDVARRSIDLVNADYTVGVLASYRLDRFSGFIRAHHQSSHLGDEFLLNNPGFTRINLSFEELDAKLSYELATWLRVYGGGGFIVHRFPEHLGRGTSQWGAELTSTRTFAGGRLRPVAYADFQSNERSNWTIARSVLAGVQFENARIGDRRIQLLAGYFAGPPPDGQFYNQRVEWYSVGIHFYF